MKRRSFLKTAAATALGMQIVPRHALGGPATARAGIPPQPIISRGVPAFASSGTASYANNAHYWNEGKWAPDTEWISYTSPAWLAYDLAGVAAPKRSKLLVIWYGGGSRYDYTIVAGATYRMPGPYLLEGNAAPGGGSRPPATGWVPLVTGDKPQVYHSRQHIVDFAGYNWLRFRTLAENPFNEHGGNVGVAIKLDVYDAAGGITDDWILYGDSITEGEVPTNCIGSLIHARLPKYNPIWEGGGIGFMTARDGAEKLLPKWLSLFPGRYVCLAYGTNDANLGRAADESDSTKFYQHYESMVKQILAVKKTPVIGTIIWARDDGFRVKNLERFNTQLQRLKAKYPQILAGPDLYGTFNGHPEWYRDDLHPNAMGGGILRRAWAEWALKTVYGPAADK